MRITVLIVSFCVVALVAFKLGVTGSAATSSKAVTQNNTQPAPAEEKKADNGLPECDSKEAKKGLKDTFEDNTYSNTVKIQLVDMDKLAEVSYDAQNQVRSCIGQFFFNIGNKTINYTFLHAKDDPSRLLISTQAIAFKLPDITPDKDMDVNAKNAFQGAWHDKPAKGNGQNTFTFTGDYVTVENSSTPTEIVTCRILKYEKNKNPQSKGEVAFSFCRSANEAAVNLDCKEQEIPYTVERAYGRGFGPEHTEYRKDFSCKATEIESISLLEDGMHVDLGLGGSFILHKRNPDEPQTQETTELSSPVQQQQKLKSCYRGYRYIKSNQVADCQKNFDSSVVAATSEDCQALAGCVSRADSADFRAAQGNSGDCQHTQMGCANDCAESVAHACGYWKGDGSFNIGETP